MIQFELPQDVEEDLRKSVSNLDETARAALLVQSYRDGLLSLGKVAELRGKGVLETQEWLARHGAPLNYDHDDLAQDTKTLAKFIPDART